MSVFCRYFILLILIIVLVFSVLSLCRVQCSMLVACYWSDTTCLYVQSRSIEHRLLIFLTCFELRFDLRVTLRSTGTTSVGSSGRGPYRRDSENSTAQDITAGTTTMNKRTNKQAHQALSRLRRAVSTLVYRIGLYAVSLSVRVCVYSEFSFSRFSLSLSDNHKFSLHFQNTS